MLLCFDYWHSALTLYLVYGRQIYDQSKALLQRQGCHITTESSSATRINSVAPCGPYLASHSPLLSSPLPKECRTLQDRHSTRVCMRDRELYFSFRTCQLLKKPRYASRPMNTYTIPVQHDVMIHYNSAEHIRFLIQELTVAIIKDAYSRSCWWANDISSDGQNSW